MGKKQNSEDLEENCINNLQAHSGVQHYLGSKFHRNWQNQNSHTKRCIVTGMHAYNIIIKCLYKGLQRLK